MILLQSPQTLQIVLGAAITTNQLPVTASWNDMMSPAANGSKITLTNSMTAVTIAPTPTGGVTRKVQTITIQNQDTVAATVTVSFFDGTNTRQIIKATLQTGEHLLYDLGGWRALDSVGTVKQTQSNSSAQMSIIQSNAASGVSSAQLSVMSVAASGALSAATSDSVIASTQLSTMTVAASQAKSAVTSVSTVTSTVLSRASSGGS